MSIRRIWQRPETVPIWAESKVNGVLADPSEDVLLTLTNPSGTVVLNAVTMVKSSTGLYVYYWTSSSDSVVGWYKAKAKFQDGTGGDAKVTIEYGGFELQ